MTARETEKAIVEGGLGFKKRVQHNLWKYIGAMFMSEKNGVQAMSLSKVLTAILFIACVVMWAVGKTNEAGVEIDPIQDSQLYTLWGLLGLRGVSTMSGAIRTKK